MTTIDPFGQEPGDRNDAAGNDADVDTFGDGTTDLDRPLDPDVDPNQMDSAAADEQAATEGELPSDSDR